MNKKIVILIVIVECILAILLIGIIGKAIETYFNAIQADEVYFTTSDGTKLTAGMKYFEKTDTIEMDENNIEDNIIVIVVARWDRGYQLHWDVKPDNTSDKSVTFMAEANTEEDIEVSVNETGFVFFEDKVNATITISTTNGKTAVVQLITIEPKSGDVDLGD